MKQDKENEEEMKGTTALWIFLFTLTLITQSWINLGLFITYTFFLFND